MEIAAASFNKASPSTKRVRRVAAPISLNMPATAEGSVVATIAPTSRQTVRGIPEKGYKARPIVAVETMTATMANKRTVPISWAKRRTSIANAA